MDRTEASDAFNAGSIPVGCIFNFIGNYACPCGGTQKKRNFFQCELARYFDERGNGAFLCSVYCELARYFVGNMGYRKRER